MARFAKLAHVKRTHVTFWSQTRRAANRLGCKFQVSESDCFLRRESIECTPEFAVAGLRLSVRETYSQEFCSLTSQGASANAFNIENSNKDVPALLSTKSALSPFDLKLWLKAHLHQVPCKANPAVSSKVDKNCRLCQSKIETVDHITSSCTVNVGLYTNRHNEVQDQVAAIAENNFHVFVNSRAPDSLLRPDIKITDKRNPLSSAYIEISVVAQHQNRLTEAAVEKAEKYKHLDLTVYPLIVGSLGAWNPDNEKLRSVLGLNQKVWCRLRRNIRRSAIQHLPDYPASP